ncbi:hypothetical protein QAD02_012244 [Eretmocerus hayati]|uniref:Uncharacterized protein n=1 Tax=Eretmocerus hayati TaxID=131215 RepID=A0ACC2NZ90_9HYME|nr:hypothetical protein QAD02_012244 [Eretmocerus hayati]
MLVSVNRYIVFIVPEIGKQEKEFGSMFALDPISSIHFKLDLPSDLRYDNQYVGMIDDYNRIGNQIHVVVRNHSICGWRPSCKVTFNDRGQLDLELDQPLKIFPYELAKFIDISKTFGSRATGDFILARTVSEPTNVRSFYIDPSGFSTDVQTFKEPEYSVLMFSNTANLFGYCSPIEPFEELECIQYHRESGTTVAVNFSAKSLSKSNADAYIVSFAHFERSIFLFAFLECGKEGKSVCKTAKVATVNSKGALLKTMLISDDLECPLPQPYVEYVSSSIAEIGNQFCFYFVCGVKDFSYESALIHTKCILKSFL